MKAILVLKDKSLFTTFTTTPTLTTTSYPFVQKLAERFFILIPNCDVNLANL